jgi:hypothetical protein
MESVIHGILPPHTFSSLRTLFWQAMKREKHVEKCLNAKEDDKHMGEM